jgi:bifunctional non-homologous end joining protein LigD
MARARSASLSRYRQKRDFAKTKEPRGSTAGAQTAHLRFVIQKHDASHLHFDLRLELDGVMKSWAVPKGPSNDPAVKRLAMQVEDHPIEYNTFEGTIPAGEYGGGTVMLWDNGTYEPLDGDMAALREGVTGGSIKFTVHGTRMKGEWALVRMHRGDGRQWLLIKHRDPFARNGGNLTGRAVRSVTTGRTMREIAAADASKPG